MGIPVSLNFVFTAKGVLFTNTFLDNNQIEHSCYSIIMVSHMNMDVNDMVGISSR